MRFNRRLRYSIAGFIILEITLLGFVLSHLAALCLICTDNLYWLPVAIQGAVLSCIGALGIFALVRIKNLGRRRKMLNRLKRRVANGDMPS